MKRVDLVVNAESGESLLLRITRSSGRLDHYFHFLQDFAWPFFDWLQAANDGLPRTVADVRTCDSGACHFERVFAEMFGFPLLRARLRDQIHARVGPARGRIDLNGYNSRFRDYQKTFQGVVPLRASANAFRRHMTKRFIAPPVSVEKRTVVLIERVLGDADRSGARRLIANHEHLRDRVAGFCAEQKLGFENVQLERLSFEEQFRLCSRAGVLLGQHGAGLANAIWMTPGETTVVELAGEGSPKHFLHLAEDLGLGYERLSFSLEPSRGRGEKLLVDSAAVIERLDACFSRDLVAAVGSRRQSSGERSVPHRVSATGD